MCDKLGTVKSVNKKLQNKFKGKNRLKNISDISINLVALKVGLKPSVLWDFCSMDVEKLKALLTLVFEEETHKLGILQVNGDFFVCELATLVRQLKHSSQNPPVIIDVSKEKTSPCLANCGILNQVKEMTLSVIEQIQELCQTTELTYVELNIDLSWNITTLYGLLLGFPVLYWFNHLQSSDNCLSHQDLQIHSIQVVSDNFSGSPTSFSVPLSLASLTEKAVVTWWQDLSLGKDWTREVEDEGAEFVIGDLGTARTSVRVVNLPVVPM